MVVDPLIFVFDPITTCALPRYGGGLARTARVCGAFFIINMVREYAVQWKTAKEDQGGLA